MSAAHRKHGAGIALAALGSFMATSDVALYAMKEVFAGNHPIPLNEANVLGSLSLFFWALVIVVSLKYVSIIMRADNRGEGGIMALIALALHDAKDNPRRLKIITIIGVLGAAMFYGDGMVTPRSRCSLPSRGWKSLPRNCRYVIRSRCSFLFFLFFVQKRGTATVGAFFGPVMLLWFGTLAALGIYNLVANHACAAGTESMYGLRFPRSQQGHVARRHGRVVLAVTGAEALYADMGHFGRKPITLAWYGFVLPSLVLNYFGQGALILANRLRPKPVLPVGAGLGADPLVALATVATVIASQAVISGPSRFRVRPCNSASCRAWKCSTRPRRNRGRSICRR